MKSAVLTYGYKSLTVVCWCR